jgi:hypothetical protein
MKMPSKQIDEDITFNNIKTDVLKEEVEESQIVSTANYDAEIYDKTTDFKSIGVFRY